jgi:protein-tyrosine-phosphatase
MRDAATELGLNLEGHRSRDITLEDIAWADGVIYMDSGNLKRLQAMVQETPQSETMQAHCLAHFGDPPRTRIPDPAFIARGTQEFHDVVLLIKHCAERLAESLAPRS